MESGVVYLDKELVLTTFEKRERMKEELDFNFTWTKHTTQTVSQKPPNSVLKLDPEKNPRRCHVSNLPVLDKFISHSKHFSSPVLMGLVVQSAREAYLEQSHDGGLSYPFVLLLVVKPDNSFLLLLSCLSCLGLLTTHD